MWTSETHEFWVRNPRVSIRECVEADQLDIVWTVAASKYYKINHTKFMNTYFGGREWRCIYVDCNEARLITAEYPDMKRPAAVWPVWRPDTHNLPDLEKWCANPVGQNRALYANKDIPREIRPVKDQQERIIVVPKPMHRNDGRQQALEFSQIQSEYRDVGLHLHKSGSPRTSFGLNFFSSDLEPELFARLGNIILPNGKVIKWNTSQDWLEWVRLMGFYPRQLSTPTARRLFNIRSCQWQAQNYKKNVKFRTRGFEELDLSYPSKLIRKKGTIFLHRNKPVDTDMLLCNTCSRQMECKYFREGSVCSVPNTDGDELAKMFKSRDSDVIIDALGTLLQKSAERVNAALDHEESTGTMLPETTKAINALFDRGERLAKLVDPQLGQPDKGPAQQNFLNLNLNATPAQLASAIVGELEGRGVPRDAITPEMVEQLMGQTADARAKAIDAVAIESGTK